MKKQKLFGLTVLALSLIVIGSCGKDDSCEQSTFYLDSDGDGQGDSSKPQKACKKPDNHVANANDPDDTNADVFSGCTMVTYYLDNDGDTFGDPDQSLELCDGVSIPDGYVTDNTDCDDTDTTINPAETTAYLDEDEDGYGNPDISIDTTFCAIPSGYSLNGSDCDDSNANVNPEAEEVANDGIDNNCDGYFLFSKTASDDWTNPQFQDKITEKVTFTRQDNDYLFNLTWWEENIGNPPVHDPDNSQSDLAWEFWGPPVNPVSDITGHDPTGGPKGIRWALLDTGDYPNTAWEDFQLYGTLGDNTHFYSLHNMASIAGRLNLNFLASIVYSDFNIDGSEDPKIAHLIGKTLGVWLEEENIYFTLKFTEWTTAVNGGTITYERSTPISF